MKENKALLKHRKKYANYENLYFPSRSAAKKAGYKDREIESYKYIHWEASEQPQRHVVTVFVGTITHNWYIHNFRKYKTIQEKRSWYFYIDSIGEVDLLIKSRRRRCPNMLPNVWDDIYTSHVKTNTKKSWKKTNKVRKQWMKNL